MTDTVGQAARAQIQELRTALSSVDASAPGPATRPPDPGVVRKTAETSGAAEAVRPERTEAAMLTPEEQAQVREAFNQLNSFMENMSRSLRFNVYDQTGDLYVEVVNTAKDEVVKTIPPEASLELMSRINAVLGMIVDTEA